MIFDQAWGIADREKQIKNTVDTQFCIRSMNKMFTAVAILQLSKASSPWMEPSATIGPDYSNRDLARRVRISNARPHRRTGDIFTPAYEAHPAMNQRSDKIMRLHSVTSTIENGLFTCRRKESGLGEFPHEVTSFPKGKFNDQCDSIPGPWTGSKASVITMVSLVL